MDRKRAPGNLGLRVAASLTQLTIDLLLAPPFCKVPASINRVRCSPGREGPRAGEDGCRGEAIADALAWTHHSTKASSPSKKTSCSVVPRCCGKKRHTGKGLALAGRTHANHATWGCRLTLRRALSAGANVMPRSSSMAQGMAESVAPIKPSCHGIAIGFLLETTPWRSAGAYP